MGNLTEIEVFRMRQFRQLAAASRYTIHYAIRERAKNVGKNLSLLTQP